MTDAAAVETAIADTHRRELYAEAPSYDATDWP
jgi:hypothetical protein